MRELQARRAALLDSHSKNCFAWTAKKNTGIEKINQEK
jgi:hypothetical protein